MVLNQILLPGLAHLIVRVGKRRTVGRHTVGKEGASHRSKYQLSNQIANSKLQIEKIAFVIVGHWTMDIAWLSSKTITDNTLAANIACYVMEENKKDKITIL